MEREITEVYCGSGRGKSTLAIGQSIRAAVQGKSVIIVQFMKGKEHRDMDFLEDLENMDIKIFRFEKLENCYDELTEEEKEEEKLNIQNAWNFARKVIVTQECDFLLLDEILALPELGIVSEDAIAEVLHQKDDSMHIVMTGREISPGLRKHVDSVIRLTAE